MSSLKHDQPVVLIVDSDPLVMTGMAAILHMQGYQCHCAQSTKAAIKAAETHPLDLVVCEVRLNHACGLSLCDQLHDQLGDDLPVIFLAANGAPELQRRLATSPNTYFLQKPFEPQSLLQLAENALWFPHLVQSNLEAEGRVEQPAAESHQAADVHKHTSTPAPMRITSSRTAANPPAHR